MYQYKIKKIRRIIDGDTVDVEIDLGFGITYSHRVRLKGINTAETKTSNLEEKAKGLAAKEWLKKELVKIVNKNLSLEDLMILCTKLYEKSYSALDIIHLLENVKFLETKINEEKRYEMLLCFYGIKTRMSTLSCTIFHRY